MSWTRSTVTTFLLAVLALASPTAWAGEMEPPVPPGTPTMKPIDEIEPRRAIRADMLPLTISDEGSSWYLAESISTGGAGITIDANHVTIDLMGHTLEGGAGIGIRDDSSSTPSGTTIKNGTVRGWSDHGIALHTLAVVSGVRVEFNGGNGIQLASDGHITDSVAYTNAGHGFDTGRDAYVRGCQSNWNLQNGFLTGPETSVSDCLATGNLRNGIRVNSGSIVVDSSWTFNDQTQVNGGAGIWVEGGKNRIERNHFRANNIGIKVDGDHNIIVRNTLPDSHGDVYDVDPVSVGNFVPNFTIGTVGSPGPWDNLCGDITCP